MLRRVGLHSWEIALDELPAPFSDRVRANPLSGDSALFDMYLHALDHVLAEPEVLRACADFGLSANTLRMKMLSEGGRVLGAASDEYAAYKAVADGELRISGAIPSDTADIGEIDRRLRPLCAVTAAIGALMDAAGAARWGPSPLDQALVWAGAMTLAAAVVAWIAPRVLIGTGFGRRLVRDGSRLVRADGGPALVRARDRLVAAVSEVELLAQVRTFINAGRHDTFGHVYAVSASEGLSDL
jgi:hypothetical protein